MINQINHELQKDKYGPYIKIIFPNITHVECGTLKDPYLLNSELNELPLFMLNDIVKELEEVKYGERERAYFGFEVTMIWCYKKGKTYYGKINSESEVAISFNFGKEEIITNLKVDDILKMMTDYRDYVDAWEKETGRIKK